MEFRNSLATNKQVLELTELFQKFDADGSGTVDLNEIVTMFRVAGLKLNGKQLKKMFKETKGIKIVNGELVLDEFIKLMMSEELEKMMGKMLVWAICSSCGLKFFCCSPFGAGPCFLRFSFYCPGKVTTYD